MAKKSVIHRNKKRERMVARFASKRAALKKIIADPNVSEEDFYVRCPHHSISENVTIGAYSNF